MPVVFQNFTGNQQHHIAPFEVVLHNRPTDCWISFLGKVLNVTPLIKEFQGQNCIRPLIAQAGKDVSQWFDEDTGDLQLYVHPVTGVKVPHCPNGPLPHVQPEVPSTQWRAVDLPWWKDKKYEVGPLTKKVRTIKITNLLIFKEVLLNVCCEDSMYRIAERYSIFNSDALSYTWRYQDRNLNMNKTLEENGIPDERDAYTDLGLPASTYVPGLFIHYNDDFKWEDRPFGKYPF